MKHNLVVGSCSGNFCTLDRQTGQIRWRYNIKQDGNQTSFHGDPLVTDDLILINGDNGKQGHVGMQGGMIHALVPTFRGASYT